MLILVVMVSGIPGDLDDIQQRKLPKSPYSLNVCLGFFFVLPNVSILAMLRSWGRSRQEYKRNGSIRQVSTLVLYLFFLLTRHL